MHRASGEILSQTSEESERAKQLLKRTVDGEVESPTGVVDSWAEPNSTIHVSEDFLCDRERTAVGAGSELETGREQTRRYRRS